MWYQDAQRNVLNTKSTELVKTESRTFHTEMSQLPVMKL